MNSKAHWGYDAAFMARVRRVLTVTPGMIEAGQVAVLEEGGQIIGVYALTCDGDGDGTAELEMLFVRPQKLGAGHGARLFAHACEAAQTAGVRRLIVESDPNAVGFYERLGMARMGERASPVQRGRVLPVLELTLDRRADAAISFDSRGGHS